MVQRLFWSFFDTNVYPTCIVKQCLAPSFDKKFHPPSQFPLLFLSSLQSFAVLFLLAKQGKRIALWLALTPSPLKRFQRQNRETQNPLICNLQNAWRDTMNFGCKIMTCIKDCLLRKFHDGLDTTSNVKKLPCRLSQLAWSFKFAYHDQVLNVSTVLIMAQHFLGHLFNNWILFLNNNQKLRSIHMLD